MVNAQRPVSIKTLRVYDCGINLWWRRFFERQDYLGHPMIRIKEEIEDQTGNHKLVVQVAPAKGGVGYNFHGLVWLARDGPGWTERAAIMDKDFEHGTNRRHWIQSLHSFDSSTGRAIVKVGEEDAPRGNRVRAIYSWQEWDIQNNRQVRLFRICKTPHESYEQSISQQ